MDLEVRALPVTEMLASGPNKVLYWRVWLVQSSLEEGSGSAQILKASAGQSQGPCMWAAPLPALGTREGSGQLSATAPALVWCWEPRGRLSRWSCFHRI